MESANSDKAECLMGLRGYCGWLVEMEAWSLPDYAAGLIHDGRVYLGPRDVNGYPTIMISEGPASMKE